jgi:hypothetical protein
MKLESWSHPLATAALATSIPLALFYIWLDQSLTSIIIEVVGITIDVAAILYLQTKSVKRLYQPKTQQPMTQQHVAP